jgi:hypothetical protein
MRPWMIVLSSAIGAIVVAAILAVPEVLNAPPSDIGPILLPHAPALAVAALAVYALCSMLLTTATLITGMLRVRHHLARVAPDRASPQRDWVAAFGATGFRQLAPRLVPTAAQSRNGVIILPNRPNPSETRSEVARLYYISLARNHFFSAVIVLAGAAGLGLAAGHGPLPFLAGVIPTVSAILIFVGLLILAVLGRIAIDVTAEPLLEAMAQLPTEREEVGLLRRAVELLEVACNAPAVGDDLPPAPPAQAPERLIDVVQQGHHALLDAIGYLSANTQALGAALRSSVESLETTMRSASARQQPIDQGKIADVSFLGELQGSVQELTAVLQRLSAMPEAAERPPATERPPTAVDPSPRRSTPAPRLARELQRLLQDIAGR